MTKSAQTYVFFNDKPMTMNQATEMFGYCPDMEHVIDILMCARSGLVDVWNDLITPIMEIVDDPLIYEENIDAYEDLFGRYWAINVKAVYPNFTGNLIRLRMYNLREDTEYGEYVFNPRLYIYE